MRPKQYIVNRLTEQEISKARENYQREKTKETQMLKQTTRQKAICDKCGGENVQAVANVEWDMQGQRWYIPPDEIPDLLYTSWCTDCDTDVIIKMENIILAT